MYDRFFENVLGISTVPTNENFVGNDQSLKRGKLYQIRTFLVNVFQFYEPIDCIFG